MKICLAVLELGIMDGEKPILRMGPDMDEPEKEIQKSAYNQPTEPSWVTELRSNMKQAVKDVGFENSKPDLKKMIEDVNNEVNGQEYLPVNTFNAKKPMRNRPPKRYVPQWERELIKFVRNAMEEHGTESSLDPYVTPFVRVLERKNNVKVTNIDRQVIVSYDKLGNNNNAGGLPFSDLYRQVPPGQY